MASFVCIPQELLGLVCVEIQSNGSRQRDLAALLATCQYFRKGVEPYLYEEIKWIREDGSAPPIYLLVRTILKRKELAAYIQRIHLRGWHRTRTPRAAIESSFDQEEHHLLHSRRLTLRWDYGGPWAQGYEFGKTDFFAAILLSHCPNLQSLSLDFHYGASQSLVGTVLLAQKHRGQDRPQGWGFERFSNLKAVEFINQSVPEDLVEIFHEATIDVNHLWAPFALPSVQRIKATNVARTALEWPLRPNLQSDSLTSLILEGARCGERELERLASTCKSLRELVWDRRCDCNDGESCQPDCLALYEALLHVRQTIESIKICMEFYTTASIDMSRPGPWTLQGRLASLQSFPKLAHLHVPFAVLYGWHGRDVPELADVLPSHLLTLVLTSDTYEMPQNHLFIRLPLNRLIKYVHHRSVATRSDRDKGTLPDNHALRLTGCSFPDTPTPTSRPSMLGAISPAPQSLFELQTLSLHVKAHEW
ncbi:MAG: hypothetical protein Q9187_008649, partial [Circinaria calcarea]